MVSFHSQRVRLIIYFKSKKIVKLGWHISVIPTLRGWTQEDQVFKANLDYIASWITCQKKKRQKQTNKSAKREIIYFDTVFIFNICCASDSHLHVFSFLCLFFICFATLNIRTLNSVRPVQDFYPHSPPALFSIALAKRAIFGSEILKSMLEREVVKISRLCWLRQMSLASPKKTAICDCCITIPHKSCRQQKMGRVYSRICVDVTVHIREGRTWVMCTLASHLMSIRSKIKTQLIL